MKNVSSSKLTRNSFDVWAGNGVNMKISKDSFGFSAYEFGTSEFDITDHADLKELISIFENQFNKSDSPNRTLCLKYIGQLLETIFIHASTTQEKIRNKMGLTATQWSNKLKNQRRKERNPFLSPLLGKGTSIYLQSINKLIDYLIWGNSSVICPSTKNIPGNTPKKFMSQTAAIKFVSNILINVLFVEQEFIGTAGKTTLEEYLKAEYQNYKKNPVSIPGLKANTTVSSKRIEKGSTQENIIKKHHFQPE